ncbi:DUF1566 domain-containing protein [Vibrio sp. TH_r3]|uniref:Lcl C-terminal domain-containing protein n=1 Tax=Vibrio sp. TH_r3 TaxID=3082084 RepID=UPI00295334EA|nr:DUF1566 domain-containing protein [Vibrio sp. TH_r3]MDV7104562.1 DUF1566 domain-containing protein [Vibrio sp. TH_r3]
MIKNHLALLVIPIGVIAITTGCQSTVTEATVETPKVRFAVTDAMQTKFYDVNGNVIDAPELGDTLYGQDAQYQGLQPSYTDNGDGTVTDNNTGLMWQQTPPSGKMSYDEAKAYVESLNIGGYTDWRLPTIKESFSIANLGGSLNVADITKAVPYLDTEYFDFFYDEKKPYTGSYWTSTVTKMLPQNEYEKQELNYGFNWADGHLKAYGDGYYRDGTSMNNSIPAGVRAVRGEEGVYGVNDYVDNADGTVTDRATGFMWSKQDSGYINDDASVRLPDDKNFGFGRTWVDTLAWVQKMNKANYLGYSDWRLPDAKELQSIVQYGKTMLPATDANTFDLSRKDVYMWTSTTCGDFPDTALYLAFGKAWGINLMSDGPVGADSDGEKSESTSSLAAATATVDDFVDTHGPGAMRNDYKDLTGVATQTPKLARELWARINGQEFPYEFDVNDTTTIFDLSASENAADYTVLFNHAMLVRDAD